VREGVIAACDGILVDYYIYELVNTLKTDREGREKYHGNQGTAYQDDQRSRSRCLSSGSLFPGVCMPFSCSNSRIPFFCSLVALHFDFRVSEL